MAKNSVTAFEKNRGNCPCPDCKDNSKPLSYPTEQQFFKIRHQHELSCNLCNGVLVSIETHGSLYNNIDGNYLPLGELVYTEEEKVFKGLSVSATIESFYGISHKKRQIIQELNKLSKYPEIIEVMESLKCFTLNYLCFLLDRSDGDRTVRGISQILVLRNILKKIPFVGRSKRTFGMNVYLTHDVTQVEIDNALQDYIASDELRYLKDLQRKKKKSSAKDAAAHVINYNEEVIRQSKEKKKERMQEGKCCDFTTGGTGSTTVMLQFHSCGKGVIRAP